MNIDRNNLKMLILDAIDFYNGFLDENEQKYIANDMSLDEKYNINYNDFGAIMLLTFTYLRNKYDIWCGINKYDEELMKHRQIDDLVEYLIGVI